MLLSVLRYDLCYCSMCTGVDISIVSLDCAQKLPFGLCYLHEGHIRTTRGLSNIATDTPHRQRIFPCPHYPPTPIPSMETNTLQWDHSMLAKQLIELDDDIYGLHGVLVGLWCSFPVFTPDHHLLSTSTSIAYVARVGVLAYLGLA